jgi:hypothetical protein
MKTILEDGIVHIKNALAEKKIALHPKKTTLLRIDKWTEPILYEGEKIVVEEFSKYLGVLINQKLDLEEHIKTIEKKNYSGQAQSSWPFELWLTKTVM